jgi:serine phosphatase RsbU (regulator of sigma subunit)
MAGNYRLMGQLEQAEKMLEESFSWEKRANFNYASYGLYKEKGELAFARRNYSDAVDSYLKAKELAIREKANHDISEINLLLSQAYEKLGDYKSSTDALKVHLQFKDSVFNEESQKSILDLEEKYKSEQKDAEIKLLNKSNTLNTTELEKKRITIYAFIGFGVLLVLMLVFFVRSNINKQKTNQLLEQKNLIIEEKRKEIVDSINYAKRIQFTLLASNNLLRNNLSNYFVFFQPKDIVSGDFYWAIRTEKYFYLAVCDCTGHGVPGAFMSILNLSFLKEAITEKQITEPGEIFDFVRARLIENFSEDNYSDGMDGILLRFDNSANSTTGPKKIRYAGANRGPVLVSDEGTQLLPYDKMPVGNGIRKTNFATYDLNYSRKNQLYLFTDGFADQFGGPKGKKFKYKQLQTLLEKFKTETTINQRAILEDTFARWMGELEQVDDVCVFGITLE